MRTAIVNIGTIVSGDWARPIVAGDALLAEDELISRVGAVDAETLRACDVVIDADGAVAIPGLIDSHVHITFGDYTPRQKTVGFLESYVHGGVTTAISASEVHDRDGQRIRPASKRWRSPPASRSKTTGLAACAFTRAPSSWSPA